MAEADTKRQPLGLTTEITIREHSQHVKSIIYQELMRIKQLLGKETIGVVGTSMKALNLQSQFEEIEYIAEEILFCG